MLIFCCHVSQVLTDFEKPIDSSTALTWGCSRNMQEKQLYSLPQASSLITCRVLSRKADKR